MILMVKNLRQYFKLWRDNSYVAYCRREFVSEKSKRLEFLCKDFVFAHTQQSGHNSCVSKRSSRVFSMIIILADINYYAL